MSRSHKKTTLLVLWFALLGALVFGITHFGSGGVGGSPDLPPTPSGMPSLVPSAALVAQRWPEIIAAAAAPPRGGPNAAYTMAEFGDFQCPLCGRARPMLAHLLAQYPTQVNLIFVHRPFPNVHRYALPAAEASNVAAAQGKFWPMYDTLYAHQDDLEPGSYGDYAAGIGLDKDKFVAALLAHKGKPSLDAATALSDSLGVLETPTVLVRDNIRHTISRYVGLSGEDNPPGVPGIRALYAHPPWLAPAAKP